MVNKSHSCPNIHTSSHAFDLSQEKKTTLPDEHSRKSANESYQVFRICKERCKVLNVTIENGIGITRGKIKDWRKKNNNTVSKLGPVAPLIGANGPPPWKKWDLES